MNTRQLQKVWAASLIACMAMAPFAHAQSTKWWDKYRAPTSVPVQPPAARQEAQATPDPVPVASPQPPDLVVTPGTHASSAPRPANTYLEAGYNRISLDRDLGDEDAGGAYVRGAISISDPLYLFGSYGQVSRDWSDGDGYRLDVDIDQAEIGVGSLLPVSDRTDFITEAAFARLSAKVAYTSPEPGESIRGDDSLNAGKFALGFRSRPSHRAELWAKAGYLWLEDNLLLDNSAFVVVGGQLFLSPTWGLVGEAEVYEDVRYYRLGLRASF